MSDAIQPSHPLLSPSPPTFNLSQHQGLFQWVSSSHQVTKILELQPQNQSFQWIFRTDFLWQIDGETMETVRDFILGGSKITADGDWSHEIKRHLLLGRKAMINLDSILKSRDITLPTKVRLVKVMGFPVVMYGCESWDYKEIWVPKKWCFWTAVLEKTLQKPLDFKKIQPVYPKANRSSIFTGRTDAEAETPIFWSPDVKNWLTRKDPDAGKDWRQEEKGTTEDEMVGWPHWFDGHEFEWAPRVGDGQGSLACCSPWGRKESDMTEELNWTES